MAARREEVKVRLNRVQRVSGNDNHFVDRQRWRHYPGKVALDCEDGIVHDVGTFHALSLQTNIPMQIVVAAGRNTRQELDVLAEKRVTGSREGDQRELV